MFAAVIFGFGTEVFAAGFFYSGDAERTQLVFLVRLLVLVALTLVLVFRGGWSGAAVALGMALGATFIEWLLLPVAFDWAASQAPPELAAEIPASIDRPPYLAWAAGDLLAVAICAVVGRVSRMLAGMG
ncbi:MAG: hypothetical protein ACR2KW_00035 [Rubrobacter sp.]